MSDTAKESLMQHKLRRVHMVIGRNEDASLTTNPAIIAASAKRTISASPVIAPNPAVNAGHEE